MTDVKILVWAINESRSKMETMCASLLETARLFAYQPELLGVGHVFTAHKQRLWILQERLQKMPPSTLVVCMDGSDTLFNDYPEVLVEKFESLQTQILISAERAYSYQYPRFRHRFDEIESPYRYVNAGTFMGYSQDLLRMINEMLQINERFSNANDQGLLGIWAYENLEFPERVKLDTTCELFWVTTHDWNQLYNNAITGHTIFNLATKQKPLIIHNVGNGHPDHFKAYKAALENIIGFHQTQTWQIFLLSPFVTEAESRIFPPLNKEYQQARAPVWDLFRHPNIHTYYYGADQKGNEEVLSADSPQEAIRQLSTRFHCDCIVHLPKDFLFYYDELYEYITQDFAQAIKAQTKGYDAPQWESFIYYQKRYYPIPIFFDPTQAGQDSIDQYLAKAKEDDLTRPLQKFREHCQHEMVSIGGWCGPAVAMLRMQIRKRPYAFCTIYSSVPGVIEMTKGNREVYYQDDRYFIMPHFDIHGEKMRETVKMRIRNYYKVLQSPEPILFVRTITSPDYQEEFQQLIAFLNLLREKYGRKDRLLILLHDQGIGTVKVKMLQPNIMIWAVAGQVGWGLSNIEEIIRNYSKAIEYCLEEGNWQMDFPMVRGHAIRNHHTKGLCQNLYNFSVNLPRALL